MSILECDLGNSRCNWRVCIKGEVIERGVATVADSFSGIEPRSDIRRARVASVAKDDVHVQLISRLEMIGVRPEIAVTQPETAGVRNAYGGDFGMLGVDRWLAVVAAYQYTQTSTLVLDAGSALTADAIDNSGVHLGGYILPGYELMKTSLLGDTGKVRFDQGARVAGLEFGCNTQAAVLSGLMAAQVGACRVAIEELERRMPEGFAILLTGGFAEELKAYLPERARVMPELVLDGLRWVLP